MIQRSSVLNASTPTSSLRLRAAMLRAAAEREMSVLFTPPSWPKLPPPARPLAPSLQWQAPMEPLASMASTWATELRRLGSRTSLTTGSSSSRGLSR